MANNNIPVSSWRISVSETLGRLDERSKNIHSKLEDLCLKQGIHEGRIDKLELIESNRSAVQKRMTALMALIVATVTTLSNIAWQIFH